MFKTINLGNERSSLEILKRIKEKDKTSFDIRITNSHIKNLNAILGKNVFKKDALFINAETLREIMKPIGGKGKHHFHGLDPFIIFDILSQIKNSQLVIESYDQRYLIITIAELTGNKKYAVIVQPNCYQKELKTNFITRIVTIYPYNKK